MSTSGNSVQTRPKVFDLTSEDDDKELKTWCNFHWQDTFSRAIKNFNAPFYHDCCVSFTRKGCIKKISHPPLQSASVLKIPSLRRIECADDLYRWLKERLELHHRLRKKTYFPSINVAHFSSEEEHYLNQDTTDEMLCKRCSELASEKEKAVEVVKQLKEENKRLLGSSKMWCQKYQEIMQPQVDKDDMYLELSPKKKVKSAFSVLDL